MTAFFLLAALMIGAALAFVVVPLLRHARSAPARDATARRLRALDDALAEGVVDADEYAAKRAELGAAAKATPVPPSRLAFGALLLAALLLPATAILLYRLVGAPQALDPANLAATAPPHGGDRGPEMEKAITLLAERLKQQPDDVEGWALLGRAYQAMGRAAESLDAFKRAHELAKDNATLAVEYAQALALSVPGQRIDGEPRALLENALKTEPTNQRALWLLGISDYQAGRYDAAISRWNLLLPLLQPGSEVAQSVQAQIADAEAKRDGKPAPLPATAPAAETAATGAADATPAPQIRVSVSLSPALKDKFDPEATLFVFARAASGPPMPLAIQKRKAGELPLTVTLDDGMAMMPTMKLSTFPQVVVGARVSKSGNAMPQSGDLQTVSAPLQTSGEQAVTLTIDQVVP
ncbi:c-type cytochrome biogenesis protein CcmI [Dokdonella sp.]|uniref:c-type cytochrome biogenesis protein CcmI n=1 Tax=Dokdonella sp. TaxID=2291710 RepID=UPI001B0470D0|nr:c-type cytochrome biogenesis protein CcmI [Dokdonella sp.]MBO9664000.1 c-type cytochrome biogenesis protein CcmI [Dokdonella sp.]